MRRVHSGHATTAEQALVTRTAALPSARRSEHDTGQSADNPTQWDRDDSIDDLDELPDDGPHRAAATAFGLYDAHEEADKW